MKKYRCHYCGAMVEVLLTHMMYGGGLIHMCKKCYFNYLIPFYEPDIEEIDHEVFTLYNIERRTAK